MDCTELERQIRQHWEQRILDDEKTAGADLRKLAQNDHEQFIAICHLLARGESLQGQRVALELMGFHGNRNDEIAEQAAIAALEKPILVNLALRVLGRVGTTAAFSVLLPYVEAGNHHALLAILNQAREPKQRYRVLQLARRYLLSDEFYLRTIALRTVQRLSTPEREEQLLLQAAFRHPDELLFAALRHASPQALPALRDLQSKYRPGSAEYDDIMRAITAIEAQAAR